VQLAEGQNTIAARALSHAGTQEQQWSGDRGPVPPRLSITAKDQTATNKKMISVSGTVDDATALVRVNNTPVQWSGGLTPEHQPERGRQHHYRHGRGPRREPAKAAVSMLERPRPHRRPSIPRRRSRDPQFTVMARSEPGAQVDLFVNSGSKGKAKADDKGVFSIKINLTEGNNALTAVAYDTIGNASASSAVVNVFLDTRPPKIL
jgi:hypothetical protein